MNLTGILIQTNGKKKFIKHSGKFEQWQDIWHKGSIKKKFGVNMVLWLLKIFWLSQTYWQILFSLCTAYIFATQQSRKSYTYEQVLIFTSQKLYYSLHNYTQNIYNPCICCNKPKKSIFLRNNNKEQVLEYQQFQVKHFITCEFEAKWSSCPQLTFSVISVPA